MKRVKFWGAILVFALLLLQPQQVVQNAQCAMKTWYSSVAPALFPFLVLMPLLTSKEACRAYENIFSKWMRPLFRLPGSAAPAIIAGMVAGSPGGALTLCRVAKNSQLSLSEARRIALALGGVSPAYLIMGVGQSLHGSVSVGIKLAAVQLFVQMLLLLLIPDDGEDEKACLTEGFEMEKLPVASAVEGVIGICGYMVFYSIIAGMIAGILGKRVGEVLLPFMDLPSGLAALAGSSFPFKKLICGMAIGFTGLCIISQNMNVLRELKLEWKEYLSVRMVSAVLSGMLSMMIESNWQAYTGWLPEIFRKTYSISLLIIGIIIIPGLFLFSNKLFLNNRKNEKTK